VVCGQGPSINVTVNSAVEYPTFFLPILLICYFFVRPREETRTGGVGGSIQSVRALESTLLVAAWVKPWRMLIPFSCYGSLTTANLEHQLEQAPELRKLGIRVILVEGLRDLTTAQRIALTMFYRSLQTHEAIEFLLQQKLVEGARVLVRVLVECEVNCAYMLLVGDEETATDFAEYRDTGTTS